jgi:ABC-type uncharacterized transport system substrate-binding protein
LGTTQSATDLLKVWRTQVATPTGLSPMGVDLSGKRLELLKEAVPDLSRVALLVDPTDPFKQLMIKSNQDAAQALGLSLRPFEIGAPDDVEPAFANMVAGWSKWRRAWD